MNCVLLLGSGVSVPSGLPATAQITASILNGRIWNGTDGRYLYPCRHSNESIGYFFRAEEEKKGSDWELWRDAGRAGLFVNLLKRESDRFEHRIASLHGASVSGRSANYEQIFYLAQQIEDSEGGEFENPALNAFVENLWDELKLLFPEIVDEFPWKSIGSWAEAARRYISSFIRRMLLLPEGVKFTGLKWIEEGISDAGLDELSIFSLNHDHLVEKFLRSGDIPYADGFSPINASIYAFRPESLENSTSRVSLFKLHGSLSWRRFRAIGRTAPQFVGYIPQAYNNVSYRRFEEECDGFEVVKDSPEILVGTFNKMLSYQRTIYFEMLAHFNRMLRKRNKLCVCGYGFGDKGINTIMVEWLDSTVEGRLVIVHPDEDELIRGARGAFQIGYQRWKESGKLRISIAKSEEAEWNAIKGQFD